MIEIEDGTKPCGWIWRMHKGAHICCKLIGCFDKSANEKDEKNIVSINIWLATAIQCMQRKNSLWQLAGSINHERAACRHGDNSYRHTELRTLSIYCGFDIKDKDLYYHPCSSPTLICIPSSSLSSSKIRAFNHSSCNCSVLKWLYHQARP